MSSTKGNRTYKIWACMKARCIRKTSPDYPKWGGRGITVCKKWLAFDGFLEDMGDAPEGMSIDRINNDGNYEPSNCRWATRKQQNRNTSSNSILTFNGQTHCVSEWAEITGLTASAIYRRIKNGWSTTDVLTIPATGSHANKLIEFKGQRLGLAEWAKKIGISTNGLHTRISRGWSLERALTT